MEKATKPVSATLLERRRFLKLAAAAITVAAGCSRVKPEPDLDTAMSELNRILKDIGDNGQKQVISIAQRIKLRAGELADEHRAFTASFDRLLSRYDTNEAVLGELTGTYNRNRVLKRNELLRLQDELHAALTPDEWAEVVRVLNRAGTSLAGYTLSGS